MEKNQVSRIKQMNVYTIKFFRIFFRQKGWKVLVFAGLISLIVAKVIGNGMFNNYRDTESGAFTMVSACIWIGLFNSIQLICKERSIVKREHMCGLHMSSYFMAHMIVQAIICISQSFIIFKVYSLFMEFPSVGIIFRKSQIELLISWFLIIYCADILGLTISAVVKTPMIAMTVMPFILIVQLLMSGVLFELDGIMIKVAYFTISKWGMGALGSTANLEKFGSTNNIYEFSSINLINMWVILGVFIFLESILAIVALQFVDKDKR